MNGLDNVSRSPGVMSPEICKSKEVMKKEQVTMRELEDWREGRI